MRIHPIDSKIKPSEMIKDVMTALRYCEEDNNVTICDHEKSVLNKRLQKHYGSYFTTQYTVDLAGAYLLKHVQWTESYASFIETFNHDDLMRFKAFEALSAGIVEDFFLFLGYGRTIGLNYIEDLPYLSGSYTENPEVYKKERYDLIATLQKDGY